MPEGACVIKYAGKRGVVWRVKFRDADRRQVTETLGRADEGWTKRKAEAELRARLTDVARKGYKRPEPTTFEVFATNWLDTYPAAKGLKRSTVDGYTLIVERHLKPVLGPLKLSAINVARLNRYAADARAAGLAPRTVNRHLNLLSAILNAAVKAELIPANPVALVDRPGEPRRRWTILDPPEIRRVERAFAQLASEAEGEERAWREQARVIFLVVIDTGIRRGEALGLRWRSVHLADPAGPRIRVEETWVLAGIDSPKSESGERTIELTPEIASELFEHRGRSAYAGEDERVFCSPTKGTPFDVVRYAKTLRLALARAKVERYMRPFHDSRHTSITNGAAAGEAPHALMTRSGHSDLKTTQGYIDLAGVAFPEETAKRGQRLWGTGRRNRSKVVDPLPVEATVAEAAGPQNTA